MEIFEKVEDHNYFRDVLGNMSSQANGNHGTVQVRFGKTGVGFSPNYQITVGPITKRYSGRSHELFHEEPNVAFEEDNLTQGVYSFADVQEMIRKRYV